MNIKERAIKYLDAWPTHSNHGHQGIIRDLLAEIKLMQLHIDKLTEGRSEELKHEFERGQKAGKEEALISVFQKNGPSRAITQLRKEYGIDL